jgi:hypothetical protein
VVESDGVQGSRAQQRLESGLLEVMVERQSAGEAALLHDNERKAVGERPFFVGARFVKLDAAL